ncbi:MAG: ArsR family transcriptional regulator, partial [Pseudomonadota bacterium]
TVVEGRRQREFLPTKQAVADALDEARSDGTALEVAERMRETLEMIQAFDTWYTEIRRLPRSAQLSLLHLGARIAKFLPSR